MGTPKALVRDADGTSWLVRSVSTLREGGCDRVLVVLGASAGEARSLLDGVIDGPGGGTQDVDVVVAEDWDTGMGASLRAGSGGAHRWRGRAWSAWSTCPMSERR